jgi:multisubunit Na+/H+ antiporter MnhG subunit
VVAVIALVAGTSLQVLAVLGVAVMREPLDRLHYVGLAGFGALLVGAGVILRAGMSLIGDKALATGALLVLLGPILVHVTARSLRIRAEGDWRGGVEAPDEGEANR